jgi:hypothetical protein
MAYAPLPDFLEGYPKPWLHTDNARGWRAILVDLVDPKQYPELDARAAYLTACRAVDALLTEANPEVARETGVLLDRLVELLTPASATEVLQAVIAIQAARTIESQAAPS